MCSNIVLDSTSSASLITYLDDYDKPHYCHNWEDNFDILIEADISAVTTNPKKDRENKVNESTSIKIKLSKKQLSFINYVARNWDKNDIADYNYSEIRKKLGSNTFKANGLSTNERTLAQNNISSLNSAFRKSFNISVLISDTNNNNFSLSNEFLENIEDIIAKLGIKV